MDAHNSVIKIHSFLKNPINELTLSNIVRYFAIGMVTIFVPIFLLTKGFTLQELFLYKLIMMIGFVVFNEHTMRIASVHGVKKSMMISYAILLGFYGFLYSYDTISASLTPLTFLILLAVIHSLGQSFFWMGFHLYFALSSKDHKEGTQLGIIEGLAVVLGIFSPLVGGYIIANSSFANLFILVFILLLSACIPLMFSNEIKKPVYFSVKESLKKDKLNALYFFEGIHGFSVASIWPVFLFILKLKITLIGFFYFISKGTFAIATIISGKLADKVEKRKLMKHGALINGVTLFLRPLFKTTEVLAAFQSLGGISAPFIFMPLHTIMYDKAKHLNPLEMILKREYYINFAKIIMIIISIIMLYFIEEQIVLLTLLMVSGATTLVMMKISSGYEEHKEIELKHPQ